MLRKLIQFGTKINNIIKLESSYYEDFEDNWNDELDINLQELQFSDGSFRSLGFDRSRKKTKTITKRFSIDFNCTECENKAKLIDYYLRVLRSGVNKLIAIREDGEFMWIYAEAQNVNYSVDNTSNHNEYRFTIDFVAHCPYWQTFNKNIARQIPFCRIDEVVQNCYNVDYSLFQRITLDNELSSRDKECNDCTYHNYIICDDELLGVKKGCVNSNGCIVDQLFLNKLGDQNNVSSLSFCNDSSYGYGIEITLFNNWINPQIIFSDGSYLNVTGNIKNGEYLNIKLKKEKLSVYTNTSIIANNIMYKLYNTIGNIDVNISGNVDSNSKSNINIIKFYHN